MYNWKKLGPLDPVLTGFTLGFPSRNLVGETLYPVTDVGTNTGRYIVFGPDDWLRYPNTRRSPGSIPAEIEGGVWSYDTFNVQEFALAVPVTDEEREEIALQGSVGAQVGLNPERDGIQRVTNALLLDHEYAVSTSLRNTASYASGNSVALTSTTRWDVPSTSDLVGDVRTGIRKIRLETGQDPNLFWLSEDVWEYGIRWNPQVQAFYANSTQGSVGDPEAAFRALTGFNGTFMIVSSEYNTADNLDKPPVITSFWGQDAGLLLQNPLAGQRVMTFGKTFIRPIGGQRMPVFRRRDDERFTDVFTLRWRWDLKVVSNVAGYLFKTAVNVPA